MHDPLFRCATLAQTENHPQNLSMAITHTGRVASRPQTTGRDAFVKHEADRLGVRADTLERFYKVVPCTCGEPECRGWQLIYKVTGRGRGEA